MTEPTIPEIQELFNRLVHVLDGKPMPLIRAAIANAVAAYAMSEMDASGAEPYGQARIIYRDAKDHIKHNLAARAMLTALPKGAKRH